MTLRGTGRQQKCVSEMKNLKRVGSMVHIFLKGGREVVATFPISFFQGLSFLHLEIAFPLAKLCSAFERKIFSVTIIL